MHRSLLGKIVKRHFSMTAELLSKQSSKSAEHHKRRIFSGIQPTGHLHAGNYFGAIRKWKELQDQGEDIILSVVDLHAITMKHEPKELLKNNLACTASLLASGICPEKSVLFLQSSVSRHSELCWVLCCMTTMARLGHLPQFKEKSALCGKEIPLGIFLYPVLQTADILLYKATHVPVGEDQLPHIYLVQELAKNFNSRYGKTFPRIEAMVEKSQSGRLRSLRNPEKKMSKSDPDPKSRINLLDEPKVILEKCKKAITDFTSKVTYDPENRRGVATLIDLVSLCTGKTPQQVCSENADVDTAKFKLRVADVLIEYLTPIRQEYDRIVKDPGYVQKVLDNGACRAHSIADKTWAEVRNKVGLNLA
ncbi:tryptophan--tRNA ligase, mitochondrial [Neocloeon triangulifer]|uniref:tryptophan--tRNA ligase, mitochondrial n=1 Tax=Neocloeon triangulifer TaxID=2078957 RepID=UPI00286ECDB2|nr:tryptophan--tRNA ligase, mitochondrial [Neocloeon triangulifer]XP_059475906.1 tryptophan--tRNA ligase, mitochondrial [Neocloeon triangulifer]XP_059475907.1 tryptophan--tRNA ligase, mitochondrial [Neocloeon triangulifer]